ncbi:MAG: histidinol phosphate phosphatase [Sulfurimonas sp. RIFCSPHIGHO2_12_FULL_36_9]|uniref:histidinol-phosphatase n=1 Tax=Sulfurimonas sp. RIFCSPLOWO2_12_36_12 TaxID=1802253 RepID=UPI0008BE4F8D|nr:histidinol-phosphatase [Sulfurimonas sp. RIFCSPLOWO2_12_36_12]OHD96924.1 MAG: histidinol phosphate phosphatase [Sulfurimonas sp. RIFCSPLOWO2_02_FULL_36_28]OHD99176.1 MAG: histidinol phosphate phosphatase [Sulfurimonas sp. RIFCSPHIGHO2_12_FULL_36_9]OHE02160.1 MAG: histidinol phosphate phosphatase [Sulfurimonas sp. RIFCSPLOWO2_12_36_12]OHE08615.1 MAG: histidinol phosphate phosphatase [Sulfurimonas sp. RIFCSPLOWO2_12_FULL_36_74]
MIVDLHNHTKLCNHAEGEISQYIEKAIGCGIKYFGFSEHAPMNFDEKYRINFEQMREYEEAVLAAKERYKNKIEILLGYEVDYLIGYMDERVLNADVDYLIGSVHFIEEWGFDNPEFIGNYKNQNIDEIWQKYFNAIEEMAQSRLFDIVAHMDLIKIFNFLPSKEAVDIAKNALIAIKKADMSIEINVAGFRKPIGEAYPSLSLLKEANKLNIPITFASDAHTPEQVGLYSDEAIKMARSAGYAECVLYRKRKKYFIKF